MENVQNKSDTPDWVKRIGYAAAFGIGIYAFQNWDIVSTQYLGLPYTCSNMITEVTEIPPFNPLAPRLVGIIDGQGVSSTPKRIECSGVGIFANGMRAPINYRAYEEGGKWWLQFTPT